MRMMSTQFASVSPTATSVTVTGANVSSICVISEDIAVPVYWRVDGQTAVIHASGCMITVGVGGVSVMEIDPTTSVTVSLVSAGTGTVQVMGLDEV